MSTAEEQVSGAYPRGSRVAKLQAIGQDFLECAREGIHVWDERGTRYIDGISGAGAFNLGRRPPELVEAIKVAVRETDQGNFPLVSEEKANLAKALVDFVPGGFECPIYAVMRGEAMDCACKVARGVTGRPKLLTVDGGWYGDTGFALSLSERAAPELFGPLIPGIQTIPFNDAEAASQAIDERTAAVVLEPIQAENHCRAANREYLAALADSSRDQGALLIIDETQTGFGRTGTKFAFERAGIVPDILVIGEALGGGMFPIAATLLRPRAAEYMHKHPLIHLSTFGGTDVGCRVAAKALEIYERDVPWHSVEMMGRRLLAGIEALAERGGSPIRSVAGQGLLLSIDLGTAESADAFCKRAAAHGLLVLPGRVARHSIVLRPALTITESDVDAILAALDAAASETL